VAGGAVGIIKMNGHLGVIVAAAFAVVAAIRAALVAARLHNEKLSGAPAPAEDQEQPVTKVPAAPDNLPPTDPWPTAPTVAPTQATAPAIRRRQAPISDKSDTTLVDPEPGVVKRDDPPPPAMAPPGYHVYRPSSASTEPPPCRDEK
jgi:predicted outer membrane lipoprotein